MTGTAAGTRVWIIRHGETSGNEAGILRGPVSVNDELNDTGHAQARALAAHLLRQPARPQTVYASRYRRAQQTAAPLAEALGVPVQVLNGVHEVDCGDWAGQPYSALNAHPEKLRLPGGRLGFAGGETFDEIAARFMADVNALPDGTDAALVSHGGIIRIGLAALLGLNIEDVWSGGQLVHGNTDYTVLRRAKDGWQAEQLGVSVRG
ncbi:histidine phosphatase family protein [Deinococcus aquaticus]|uniref:Histidine phosphatase family protein n=2 Tax=Deinococcus aquaticus TaxID=328692 RepID=A0ABY7V2R0_9DEIO|nr:histidine phosphatase family protein [Deinococcus aquaticus]WDA58241.1 histidine phosphatase family protein [Deinococcus aquaticus]